MIWRWWPLALAVAVSVSVLSSVSAVASGDAAPTWASDCFAGKLGLDKDVVQFAPVIAGDRAPGGGSIERLPDPDGHWVPVILVHGWVSDSTVTQQRGGTFSHVIDLTANRLVPASGDRSLVGQLQNIPGAAVFTFDYAPYAARWVDDPHLGPALGKVIDCLYSASGHQKVILVGHSLGGLASRWAAAQPGMTGSSRAGEISTAVTFGTPEIGSLIAQITALATDPVVASGEMAGIDPDLLASQSTILGSVLSACGELSSQEVQTGTVCDMLPKPVRAFASDAGIALRTGSPQLRALKPWPPGIVLDALAGDTEFTVPKASGWFRLPWDVDRIPMGDMIVTKGSALDRATLTRDTTCDYQLSLVRGATDQVGLFFGLTSKTDVARQPLGVISGPCFHTALMRGRELTNEALGAVADDIASRGPVIEDDLLSAPVPASCQHRAGRLKNGSLPGLRANAGAMALGWKAGGGRKQDLLRFGDFTGDGVSDAAVVLRCYAGGVAWPDIIAFYSRAGNAREPGSLRLDAWGYSSNLGGDPHSENAFVQSMKATGGVVRASWVTQQPGDAGCCGTQVVTASLHPAGRHITATDVLHATERPAANQFFSALSRGATTDLNAVATLDVVAQSQADAGAVPALKSAAADKPTCDGVVSGELPAPIDALVGIVGSDTAPAGVERYCWVRTPGGEYGLAGLSRRKSGAWQVIWWRFVTTGGD